MSTRNLADTIFLRVLCDRLYIFFILRRNVSHEFILNLNFELKIVN